LRNLYHEIKDLKGIFIIESRHPRGIEKQQIWIKHPTQGALNLIERISPAAHLT